MKISLGISTKLILMATVIIVAAIGVVVYEATARFREDSIGRVQEMNKDFAESLGEQVYTVLQQTTDKMQLMTETVAQAKGQALSADAQQLIQNVLRANDELVSFGVYRPDGDTFKEHFFATKEEILAEFDMKLEDLKQRSLSTVVNAVLRKPDEVALINTSPFIHKAVLTVAFLTKKTTDGHPRWLIRCDIRQEPLIKLFKKRSYLTAYMVDSQGNLLVHSNPELVLNRYNMSNFDIVKKFEEGHSSTEQIRYDDGQGLFYRGTYKTLGIGGAAVIAQVEENQALAAVNDLQYQSILITVIVVGLAFIANFIFSRSITSPLEALCRATEKIAQGDFTVKLVRKSNDEIGALTKAFKKMVIGLQERDKLKSTFGKFHSKEIAQKIMAGEIKLGGERKLATVFFSDIRNFTQMSEAMTPDEVVQFLNEYMTEMVKVITKHHGVVDKYIGDAIMALWGVPSSTPDDAANAVRAALEMRTALKAINKRRLAQGKNEMRIGMGIHTGEVLAGNIGSEERLEYTVIGDTVNEASRIETANKFLSSDLLISDATYGMIQGKGFVFGPPLKIKVKGKVEEITVYQMIGTKNSDGLVETDLSRAQQESIMAGPPLEHAAALFTDHAAISNNSADNKSEIVRPATSAHYTEDRVTQTQSTHPYHQTMAPIPVMGGAVSHQANQTKTVAMNTQIAEPHGDRYEIGHWGENTANAPRAVTGTQYRFDQSQVSDVMPEATWYLVRDAHAPQAEGPYTLQEAKAHVDHPTFPYEKGFAFRQGDAEMKSVVVLPEFTRRVARATVVPPVAVPPPAPEVRELAQPEEWYVYGEGGQTYGPYSVKQLQEAVNANQIARTTYVWKSGLETWVYVYQVPGFDRRGEGSVNEYRGVPVPGAARKPA